MKVAVAVVITLACAILAFGILGENAVIRDQIEMRKQCDMLKGVSTNVGGHLLCIVRQQVRP